MSQLRLRGRQARARRLRSPLILETLEDRTLLDARVAPLPADPHAYDPADVLVRLRSDLAATTSFTLIGSERGTPEAVAPGLWKIELPSDVTVAEALAAFRVDPRLQSVQPDYRIQVQTTPNDPYFTSNMQWGLNAIGAPSAWNHTTGGNVIVAIIDTGINYNHPDLAANVWNNSNVAGDGIGNDYHGANFTSLTTTTGNVLDDNGHGTHVAGIIGAAGNNGVGVSGVNWHVQLMALKFLDSSGSGYTSGAVRAIDYAIAHGASIINASWGGGGFDQALSDAIGRAQHAGVIFVAAAGNNSLNNDTSPFYPASYNYDNVVTVAASDSTDHPASFTNYGPHTVDLYAPGVGIWSTVPSGYASYSGTSMATPFVTGALALLKAEHPDWNYHQLITRLETTVDRLPQYSNVKWGGRLDLAAALADPVVNQTHPAITGTIASKPSLGQFYRVRVIFNESINPATFSASDVSLIGPHGAIAVSSVTAVAGTNNTQFDITFPTQTAPGSYRLAVGPHIQDTTGNEMSAPFVTSFNVRSTTATSVYQSGTLNSPIKDFHTTTSTININQDGTISNLKLTVNINHTWDGDLSIRLRGPDGTTVVLFNRRGGSGHNLRATFDDAAGTSIGSGKAPFNGAFRPEQALAAFKGKNARGAWQLMVSDKAAGDEGTLLNWSLTLVTGSTSASSRTHRASLDVVPSTQAVSSAFDAAFAGLLPESTREVAGLTNLLPVRVQESTPAWAAIASQPASVDKFFATGGTVGEQDAAYFGGSSNEELAAMPANGDELLAVVE